MLKHSASRNQRSKDVKVKFAIRTFVVLAIGIWIIYQLRFFHSHKVDSENGVSSEGEARPEQLKMGRKGLIQPDSEASKYDKKEESSVKVKEEGNGQENNETEQDGEEEEEIEEIEDLVDGGIDKGGDDEQEGLDMEALDDRLDQNDSLNDADDYANRKNSKA